MNNENLKQKCLDVVNSSWNNNDSINTIETCQRIFEKIQSIKLTYERPVAWQNKESGYAIDDFTKQKTKDDKFNIPLYSSPVSFSELENKIQELKNTIQWLVEQIQKESYTDRIELSPEFNIALEQSK